MSNKRITVRDIAKIAGVSVATVSRVSNGIGQVSETTRRRVMDAIEQHGYRPNHLGRALSSRRHDAVGLVFPGLGGPYFGELIQGFESEAVQARTSVHILCTHMRPDSAPQVLEMARRVDGMAVLGGIVTDAVLSQLATLVPVVVLGGPGPGRVPSVRVDNAPSMFDLGTHLMGHHGIRRITFIGTPEASPDVGDRWAGLLRACQDFDVPEPDVLRISIRQEDGVYAADQLLSRPDRPEAIVCANDETALGVLVGALGRGLRVPEDVVITGFDDAPMSRLVQPALTTVRQPIRELAAETARQLLQAADDRESLHDVLLPTQLVIRGSCGCRARAAAPALV